jgi:hypothetical protein
VKILLTILLLLIPILVSAPDYPRLAIEKGDVLKPYQKILNAFFKVESNNNPLAVGKLDDIGILQIRPVAIKEANRICQLTGNPARFTLNDRLDSAKSVQVWFILMEYKRVLNDLKKTCEIWNPGSGESYYIKIQNQIIN